LADPQKDMIHFQEIMYQEAQSVTN
jgi:exoribonuclease-2